MVLANILNYKSTQKIWKIGVILLYFAYYFGANPQNNQEMEGKNLVIVESPGKVKTIQQYLGKEYLVKASKGHIRDLEEHKLSVDIEHGFIPEYVIPADKKRIVAELKKLADAADTVWLASDEDREGEAISWHLTEALALPPEKTRRIVFHEITKNAILKAVEEPRGIDMNLVYAQQARRVLDRLVGFELSPVLWRKIQPKLSAGRVQSVALRLIVDREKEIMAFTPQSYYKVEGQFVPEGSKTAVKATLDTRFNSLEEARKFLEDSIGAHYRVQSVEKKEAARYPAAPFTTSTLQQEASRKLRFSVSVTMRLAQSLYERGLITYMRTDSTNLSSLAIGSAKKYIEENFGAEYSHTRQYHTRAKGAQEAHEAIRPTHIDTVEINGTPQEKKLYRLIWNRTLASQMAEAKVMNTSVKFAGDRRSETYGILATEILFDGFMKVYLEGRDDEDSAMADEVILPGLNEGDVMVEKGISAQCKFSAPPARYSEAALVKKLEELGIGRPSTYASTVDTLTRGRGYAVKGDKEGAVYKVTNLSLSNNSIRSTQKNEAVGAEKGKLLPQEIGMMVTDYLVTNFNDILDYDFTANVETFFDEIAEGNKRWNEPLAVFYTGFHKQVDSVLSDGQYGNRMSREIGIAPDGQKLVASFGKFGPYVQKGEGENKQCASLAKGQLIETLTVEEALKLFELPRTVGVLDGESIIATKGKFGPYLRFGSRNIKLPRGVDPLSVSLEECIRIIHDADKPAPAAGPIAEFGDIKILNGRYGAYIKQGDNNYKIPKGVDAATLTEAECQAIIASGGAKTNFKKGRKK